MRVPLPVAATEKLAVSPAWVEVADGGVVMDGTSASVHVQVSLGGGVAHELAFAWV